MCNRTSHETRFDSHVRQKHAPDGRVQLVEDGVICSADYRRFPGTHVIHILKEPTMAQGIVAAAKEAIENGKTKKGEGYVSSGNRYDLWPNVCRRSLALQQARNFPDWEMVCLRRDEYSKALLQSAIFNLNDTIPPEAPGKRAASNWSVLKQMALVRWAEQGPRLYQAMRDGVSYATQGNLPCGPVIVLCSGAGVFDLFCENVKNGGRRQFELRCYGKDFALLESDGLRVPIVRVTHPAHRKKGEYGWKEFERSCMTARAAAVL